MQFLVVFIDFFHNYVKNFLYSILQKKDRRKMNKNNAKIKIIGVGGAGCNAVNHMVEESIKGVEFFGLNTDTQALEQTEIPNKIQIGKKLTNGLGAGSEPHIGKESAEEDEDAIKHFLEGCDMVFITAGMGGGTGTGAAPVVARYAKEMGILTIGIVTRPFDFENRSEHADCGIEELKCHVDSLIVIPNEKLLPILGSKISIIDAFMESNNILLKSVKGIAELITNPGVINVDFADVKRIMVNSGVSMMGLGIASGENRAKDAINQALNSDLLEASSINGAKGILINVSGSMDLPLDEYQSIGKIIRDHAHSDAKIISGMTLNHEMNDSIIITIVATCLDLDQQAENIETFDETNPLPFIQNQFKETIFNISSKNSTNNDIPVSSNTVKDKACSIDESGNTSNINNIPADDFSDDSEWDLPSFLKPKIS